MGQILSAPIIEKHTSSGADKRIMWAISEMQGWRISMEDDHTTISHLLETDNEKHLSLFAVYDGHGGSFAAKYAGKNLYMNLKECIEFPKGNYENALRTAFHDTDAKLKVDPAFQKEPSGCTAVVTFVSEDCTIYCANAGDSRAVLSDGGMAEPLSFDHKPGNPAEAARITAAGGFVELGRVNGNLALSRALGDFEFKLNESLPIEQQIVTCDPDITKHAYKESFEFFIVACDGIWDVLSSQEAIDLAAIGIAKGNTLNEICESMIDSCLATEAMAAVGCDNMTICICALLNGQSEQVWREKIKARVESSGIMESEIQIVDEGQDSG